MKTFRDRVAVVTGGASGIGRAMAERFARAGVKIVLADIERAALDVAVEEMQAGGAQVLGVHCDVAETGQVEALAKQTVDHFGGVHILCNNAGVASQAAPAWEQTDKDWQWVMNVNLWGVIHGIRAFVPIMLRQADEGHVVNTASLAGLLSLPMGSPYHATKFAVVAISEALHLEFESLKSKLKVTVLCPAWVNTKILESARNRPGTMRNEVARPEDPMAEAYRKRIAEEGLPPAFVAEKVFEAVRDEQLYTWTHPQFKDAVRKRTENILEERNPTLAAALGGLAKDVPKR